MCQHQKKPHAMIEPSSTPWLKKMTSFEQLMPKYPEPTRARDPKGVGSMNTLFKASGSLCGRLWMPPASNSCTSMMVRMIIVMHGAQQSEASHCKWLCQWKMQVPPKNLRLLHWHVGAYPTLRIDYIALQAFAPWSNDHRPPKSEMARKRSLDWVWNLFTLNKSALEFPLQVWEY